MTTQISESFLLICGQVFKTIYVPIWKLELIIAYDLHDSSNL